MKLENETYESSIKDDSLRDKHADYAAVINVEVDNTNTHTHTWTNIYPTLYEDIKVPTDNNQHHDN